MNILPCGPEIAADEGRLSRYFADLRRWNFDIAYNAYYAFPYAKVVGEYRELYRRFAARAHDEGIPAFIQIQSVVAHLDDLPVTESQRYLDNRPHLYEHYPGHGKVYHFASFGSVIWMDFLKRLTLLFREFGFDGVVFEEPMLRTDIPGPDDPLARCFREAHPDLEYPTRQNETREYLTLQQFKRDSLVAFYDELTRHARSAGFTQIGIMPWFFTPTFENTPAETWNSCCDTGRLTFLDSTDFIVVRMQPDNIYAQVMTAAEGASHPTLSYYECMAHHLGKPLIMVNNPSDEHSPEANRADSLIPYDFFARYTLAAAGAGPQGMSRHWYGQNLDRDGRYMDLMAQVNAALRRLGPPRCDTAFVFSYAGLSHVYPRPARDAWRAWWQFAQEFGGMLHAGGHQTLYAETMTAALAANPDLSVLVFSEWFPLPPDDIRAVEEWLNAVPGRHIIYIGGRPGYRWGHDSLFDAYRMLPPEMLELWGVDTAQPIEMVYLDERADLVGHRALIGAADGDDPSAFAVWIGAAAAMKPRYLPGIPVETVVDTKGAGVRVVTRRRFDGGGEAWLIGVSQDGGAAGSLVSVVLDHVRGFRSVSGAPGQTAAMVRGRDDLFVTATRTGHVLAANASSEPATLIFPGEFVRRWCVNTGSFEGEPVSIIPPLEFRLYRLVWGNTCLLDIDGAILIRGIDESRPGVVAVSGIFHREFTVTATVPIHRADIDGQAVAFVAASGPDTTHTMTRITLPSWRDGILTMHLGA